jgi:hypothetical protein
MRPRPEGLPHLDARKSKVDELRVTVFRIGFVLGERP